jgi:hypothetical protein
MRSRTSGVAMFPRDSPEKAWDAAAPVKSKKMPASYPIIFGFVLMVPTSLPFRMGSSVSVRNRHQLASSAIFSI